MLALFYQKFLENNELQRMGHKVSSRTVHTLLNWLGYSLQANRKTLAGSSHQDL